MPQVEARRWLRLVSLVITIATLAGCASRHSGNASAAAPPAWMEKDLRSSVTKLAGDIGERNLYHPESLIRAADWIEEQLRGLGYEVNRQPVTVDTNAFLCRASTAFNLEAVLPGTREPGRNIVIGAHYDTRVAMARWHSDWPPLPDKPGTPGANDNGSGVASLLALAKSLGARPQARTLRLVFFVNEEPPFFERPGAMGSLVYAQDLAQRGAKIDAMLSLETLGVYSERAHRKRTLLAGFAGLPASADYVAFLGNISSWEISRQWAESCVTHSPIMVRTWSLPVFLRNEAWSDDWSFWQYSFPAFTVTDTAFLRSDDYHELSDTPEKLDYPAFAQVVWGLEQAIRELANR